MKFDEIIAYERRDAAQEATIAAKKKDIFELLEEYGEIPDSLREKIEDEASESVLKSWLKLAARVDSIEAFIEKCKGIPFM